MNKDELFNYAISKLSNKKVSNSQKATVRQLIDAGVIYHSRTLDSIIKRVDKLELESEIDNHGFVSAKLESKGLCKMVKVSKKKSPAKSRAAFSIGETILLGFVCTLIGFGLGICI